MCLLGLQGVMRGRVVRTTITDHKARWPLCTGQVAIPRRRPAVGQECQGEERARGADDEALCRPDFKQAEDRSQCTCPVGKRLYRNGSNCTINGYAATKYTGAERDCVPCAERRRCLRTPDRTKVRQVAFFGGMRESSALHTARLKRRIDSDQGKQMIGARFSTVEPVFGNLRHNKRLDRFMLRGRTKFDGQWKLYCMVHNIEKLGRHCYAN
jgi:hypothetical protein